MVLDSKIIREEPVLIKRNKVEGVMNYGDSNLYPQENRRLVMRSTTATGCVQLYADHIAGRGFGVYDIDEGIIDADVDVDVNRQLINYRGLTIGKLLKKVSSDYALYGGFAVHVNFNMNYEVSSVNWLPFEQIRLTEPDVWGVSSHAAICTNWSKRSQGSLIDMITQADKEKPPVWLVNLWNPRPEAIQAQVDRQGGWSNYRGQVYYFNPGDAVYPFPVYESARLDMAVEAKATAFKYYNIHRGFMPGHIINYHGSIETQDQKDALINHFKEYQGEENTNALIMLFTEGILPEGQNSPLTIERLERNVDDKLFEFSSNSSADGILRAFKGMPPELVGINRQTSGINNSSGESFRSAQAVYNGRTQDERTQVGDAFSDIFSRFVKDINSDWQIVPTQLQF